MKQIKTNRAIVFGTFRPGENTLEEALRKSDDPPNVFVEKYLKDFKIDTQDLKKEICRKIFVHYDNRGKFGRYTLSKITPDDIEIEFNDFHPLTQFLKSYQACVMQGGIFSSMLSGTKLDSFNWDKLRNTGRDLFNQALRNYQNKNSNKFIESRKLFLNFFRDPLCLAGAFLAAITDRNTSPAKAEQLGTKNAQLHDIHLPLLPPIIKTQIAQSDIKALPDVPSEKDIDLPGNKENNYLPAVNQSERQHNLIVTIRKNIVSDPRRRDDKYLMIKSKEMLNELNITMDKIEPEAFLVLCLSDDRMIDYFNQLSIILFDGYQDKTGQFPPIDSEMKEQWKKTFSSLLDMEFCTAGNLLASTEGLRIMAKSFEGIGQAERPDIIIPNCSLSKLYENEEVRTKFQAILKQCNNSKGSLAEYIGLCVIPKINYSEYNPDDSFEYNFDNEPSASEKKIDDLGDATEFEHFIEHLRFCENNSDGVPLRMMNIISLNNDLPVSLLTQKSFEEHNIMEFIKHIENNAGSESLKHISLCIPDKIFMNKMDLDFSGCKINTQLITVKAAFLVAAIVMRNDSTSKIRQIVGSDNKKYVQNDEPGVAIGPETYWKEDKKMNQSLTGLFELSEISSDLDIDAGILSAVQNTDSKKYSCFSLLYHEKLKPITLRVFNTAYWDEARNCYYSVNTIRTRDYLQLHKDDEKSISLVKRELSSPKPRGKVKFDDNIRHINSWMPARVKFNLFGNEKESQDEIVMDV